MMEKYKSPFRGEYEHSKYVRSTSTAVTKEGFGNLFKFLLIKN
jgi:hypothetical protein